MAGPKLEAKLGLDNSEFKRELKLSEAAVAKFGTVAAAGFAAAGVALLAFTASSIKMAIASEGVVNAFKRIGDASLVARMKEVTRGVFDDDDLKRYAIQANQLGISFKDLTTYMRFATNQAITLGKPVKEVADILINAVGKNASRGLTQIGISTKEAAAAFKEAGGFAEMINGKLSDMGDVAETTGIKIQRLGASWNDIKQQFGQDLLNSATAGGLLDWLENLSKAGSDPRIKNGLEALRMMKPNNYKEFLKNMSEIEAAGFKTMPNAFLTGKTWEGFSVPPKVIETLTTLKEKLKDEQEALQDIDITNREGLETQKKVIAGLQAQIKELEKISEIRSSEKMINPVAVGMGMTEEVYDRYSEIMKQFYDFQDTKNGLAGTNNKGGVKGMTDELLLQSEAVNILTNSFDTLFSSTENGFQNMVATMIDGMKRLVAEYLAKALIFGLIRALFPGSDLAIGATEQLWNMGLGGKAKGGLGGFQSQPLNVNVVGTIKGKDIGLALRRNL